MIIVVLIASVLKWIVIIVGGLLLFVYLFSVLMAIINYFQDLFNKDKRNE
jgi:hypothetical protein